MWCWTGRLYPEGGGQPGDTGSLSGVRVTDTHEAGGEIIHYCQTPLEVGSEVEGCIDWERRLGLMQMHSGEHILSGIVHRASATTTWAFTWAPTW